MSDLRVAFKLDAEAIDTIDAKRGKTPRSVVLRQAVVASVLGIESTPGGVVDRIGEIVDKIDWGEGYPYPTLEVEFTAFDNMLGIDRPAARYSRKGRWAPKAEATDAEVADAVKAVKHVIAKYENTERVYITPAQAREVLGEFWRHWSVLIRDM